MGTKVQCATYLPGVYTMKDLNEDADGSSSHYNDSKTSGRNLYNGFKLSSLNGYTEYEMIRRTIIEQQATFNKQVFELHRVYKVQKGLMTELSKGPYRYLPADALQSNSFSSQIPSRSANKFLQITPPVNFCNEKGLHSGPIFTGKEISLEDSGNKRFPRRTFGLQLPADSYVGCDEIERLEKEIAFESSSLSKSSLKIIQGAQVETDMKLALEIDEGSRDFCTQNGQLSTNFLGMGSFTKNQCLQLLTGSKTSPFFGGKDGDGTSSYYLSVNKETTRELSLFNNESGQSSRKVFNPASSSKDKFSIPAGNILLNQKPSENLSLDQYRRDAWIKPKPEISAINPQYNIFMDSSLKNTGPAVALHSSFTMPANTSGCFPLNYGNPSTTWLQNNGEPGSSSRVATNPSFFVLNGLPSSSQVKEKESSKKIFGIPISELTKPSDKGKQKNPILETQIPPQDPVNESIGRVSLNFDLNLSAESEDSELFTAPVVDLVEKPDETLVVKAAESIILLSSEVVKPRPVQNPSFDALHWLAEQVVASDIAAGKETSDGMIDEFEQMTLELNETKPEEYWCQPWGGQVQLDEENDGNVGKRSAASLLLTKPRRGQARKRRQRRDFQRDILPGLASLSRQEVIEDIQTIGGLMKASGESWPPRITRRNGGRDRYGSRGRGGRRARNVAVAVEEIKETPPIPPPPEVQLTPNTDNNEGELEGTSMIGWGRTTRRCRRQRFTSVENVAAPLT